VICGLTVATSAGVHLRCTLSPDHGGGCDPYAAPGLMRMDDLLRSCAFVLKGVGQLGNELALELLARAVLVDSFRRSAETDRRRGFLLPLAWVNRLDNVPDPAAERVGWAVPR